MSLKIDQIVRAFHDDLASWLKEQKGVLSIARDPIEPLEILTQSPEKFIVVLLWNGDDQLGDEAAQPLASNSIEVYVGRGLGLAAMPQQAVVFNRAGSSSLLRLVNDVRARVLSLAFPEDETMETPGYAGCVPVTLPNNVPLAAYKFTVRLQAEIEVAEEREAEIEEE